MFYPEDIVEEVRTKNDIVDIVSGYVKLQKKGSNYFGLCPFHNEKSPSFSVSPSKQMYYCFGCGAGGNAITFLMEYENYSFVEALKFLAQRAGVELPQEEYSKEAKERADTRSALLEMNKLAAKYYYAQLKTEGGRQAREYLQNRQLSQETITAFGLGYSSKYSDDLFRYLKMKGYSEEMIIKAGLVNVDEKHGVYDKFWNRVMFPIMDVNNRVIGFGGRVMGDARSFEILDKVFLKEPVDTFYASRREMGTVITLACTKPDETCFCRSFDIDPANPAGDVSCWMDEETLYWQANTAKGETLTSELPMLEDGGEEAVKAQQEELHVILEKLPLAQLDLSKVGAGKTEALFNRPEWKSLSESCLGCGTCTFVCPTCQCYDVQEFNTGKTVRRFRCWDSCMYSDFTKMSAGQPRPTQLERFRQRFMHKLVYFPDNNDGQFGCVGCGRCLQKCPIHMNIVKVIKTMGGGDDAK